MLGAALGICGVFFVPWITSNDPGLRDAVVVATIEDDGQVRPMVYACLYVCLFYEGGRAGGRACAVYIAWWVI